MPSPIAHAVSGYAIYRFSKPSFKLVNAGSRRRPAVWLAFYAVGVAIAADLDFVPQILTGDRYHHGPTHSITFALGTALIAWLVSNLFLTRSRAIQLGLVTFALYDSHLALDLVTRGGDGIQLLWPFNDGYYQSPWLIFPSTGWSRGWFDSQHFIFLAFELGYSTLVLIGLSLLSVKRRSTREELLGDVE